MAIFEMERPPCFDLAQIFECGQSFRFRRVEPEKGDNVCVYEGVALGRYLKIAQTPESVLFYNTDEAEFRAVWARYLDLDTDYPAIASGFEGDAALARAARFSSGIRILKQDKWETLCSFIVSQNNNIPRIKGILEALCECYGETVHHENGRTFYAFPTPEALFAAGEDGLFALKTGFRAKYLYDAAKTVCEQPFFLTEADGMKTPQAISHLCKIRGVGEKVASCTMLFGYLRYDAFPIDVWVKKILAKYYPNGVGGCLAGKYAGIAQQYLFYYERCMNGVFDGGTKRGAAKTDSGFIEINVNPDAPDSTLGRRR